MIRLGKKLPGWEQRAQQAALACASTAEPFDRGHVRGQMGFSDGCQGSERALTTVLDGMVRDGAIVKVRDYAGPLWVSVEGAKKLHGNPRYKVLVGG